MNRLDKLSTKALIRLWIEAENRKQLSYFNSLNTNRGQYTSEQKEYAIEKAANIGVGMSDPPGHFVIFCKLQKGGKTYAKRCQGGIQSPFQMDSS